jgi:hypothetical protein
MPRFKRICALRVIAQSGARPIVLSVKILAGSIGALRRPPEHLRGSAGPYGVLDPGMGKTTSNSAQACVLDANEEKQRSGVAWAPRHG